MSNDAVTIGELGRRFDAHAADVRAGFDEVKGDIHAVDGKVDKLAEVHATLASHGARLDGHDIELRDLKNANANAESNRNGRITARTAIIAACAAVASSIIAALGDHLIR